MREIILLNERYGVVEIDKSGFITGYNKTGFAILSDFSGAAAEGDLTGAGISEFTDGEKSAIYDCTTIEAIISSIKGIKLIDSIFYKETRSTIVRFLKNNEVLNPFFDLVKLSSSPYLEFDSDLNILFAPDSFYETTGIEKADLLGANISIFTEKKDIVKINSAAELFKKNIINFIKIDDVAFNLKGILRIYDVEVYPVNDDNGLFSGIICHLLDKYFENKCMKMSRTIRRMSAVANFAGGIAHDYNNALTAVLGNISLAKMDAEKNSELEELLCDAESAAMKIKLLTERLGMYSRGMKPSKDKTDIKKLIESIVSEAFSAYKGDYKISISDNMMQPEIDQELISEAVTHIIENAIDAADKTDGEILIESGEIEISNQSVFRETSLVPGKYIFISITDNGAGLDHLSLGEIFDPYVTSKPGREGLGLALAYTIIKRHRGFISVETPESGGAIFKIYIPLF